MLVIDRLAYSLRLLGFLAFGFSFCGIFVIGSSAATALVISQRSYKQVPGKLLMRESRVLLYISESILLDQSESRQGS